MKEQVWISYSGRLGSDYVVIDPDGGDQVVFEAGYRQKVGESLAARCAALNKKLGFRLFILWDEDRWPEPTGEPTKELHQRSLF